MSSHRKKPFSGQQKKKQLQEKREKKRDGHARTSAQDLKHHHGEESEEDDVTKINEQPVSSADVKKGYDPNRYRLHFLSESRKEIDKRKKLASEPYTMVDESCMEMDLDEVYPSDKPLDIPKRPPWDYNLSREALDRREEQYFKGYLDGLFTEYGQQQLSYFELNLETWRQLWRVVEMADIVLIICDVRFPVVHFCPAMYKHVVEDLKKHVILVLNKVDLVPPSVVVAWKHYLSDKFPRVQTVCFTSFPRDGSTEEKTGLTSKKKRRRFNAVGTRDLLHVCETIVDGKVDLSSWREKIAEDAAAGTFDDDVITERDDVTNDDGRDYQQYQHYKDGVLTIGCVGYPNVGKSSLLNGLVGKKVVSISKTPGHTKHFQTIYLTPTVRLCDCPGLVFPSLVARPLQILAGIYPIAQVREPYSAVEYVARRVDLPKLLCLRHPEDESLPHEERRTDLEWSAMDICYAWADKRGFTTAKIARPDAYRAANHLLRLTLDARVCLYTRPPGYSSNAATWMSSEETSQMAALQAASFARGRELVESASENEDFVMVDFVEPTEETESSDSDQPVKEKTPPKVKTSNAFALLGEESDQD